MLSRVKFIDERTKKEFLFLLSGDDKCRRLHSEIQNVSEKLLSNPELGVQIPKRLIPRWYVKKYQVDNLWKINLYGGWRLVYTIRAEKIEIVTIVIEWFSHKDYEKRFNYLIAAFYLLLNYF